jgi:hypothetical protein
LFRSKSLRLRFHREDLKEFQGQLVQPEIPGQQGRKAARDHPEAQEQQDPKDLKAQPVLHKLFLIPTFRMRYH